MALFLRPSAAFLGKKAANLLPRAHHRHSYWCDRGRGVDFAVYTAVCFAGSRGTAFHGGAGTLLEELPGRMEELSLLGGQFEQSAERFLHLPAGRLGQLFRGTGLQGGGQVKEILLPQLLQKSVPAAARIVRAVVVVVLFFIASILSLQEMDELRRRRFDSMFHREFFTARQAACGDGKRVAENHSQLFS